MTKTPLGMDGGLKTCDHCNERTPSARNFCQFCGHRTVDLKKIKFGKGTKRTPAIDIFLDSGDPAVFASKGALDYDPELSAR